MNKGWVKIPREILEDSIFQNANLLRLYLWLLLRAAYKEKSVMVGYKTVPLKIGELIFGAHSVGQELGIPRSTVWRHLKLLEEKGLLTVKSMPNFSVVGLKTDIDWESRETSVDTNKKENKDKKVRNIFPRKRNGFINYTDEHEDFSEIEAQAIARRRALRAQTE